MTIDWRAVIIVCILGSLLWLALCFLFALGWEMME